MVLFKLATDFQESIHERLSSNSISKDDCDELILSIVNTIIKLKSRKRRTLDMDKSITVLLLAQYDLELRLGVYAEVKSYKDKIS